MATITHRGNPVETVGSLPAVGSTAPDFTLVDMSLTDRTLASYPGKKVVNIFPSIDTPVCSASVRQFTAKAASIPGVTVLNVSADLPFAFKRFCAAEGIENAVALSTFRSTFGADWNVTLASGLLRGLCSRAVVVLDDSNRVLYTEQVPEIGQEPNYEAALAALR